MEPNETMVENGTGEEAVDTLEDTSLVEEQDESEQSLDSLLNEETDEGRPAGEKPKDGSKDTGASEPGYIKKRVEKAVNKAVAETEARMRAEFNAQMAPLLEKMVEDEAKELVRNGEIKDLETAKELVRLRRGQPAADSKGSEGDGQPRNSKGQFAPKGEQTDPATQARIDMLRHQADRIKAAGGPDVIAEWRSNKEIHDAVVSGEMDFYDVAEAMKSPKKRSPAPSRSPNGATGAEQNAISSMSDEQFERLEKKLKEGARYTLR